MINILSIRCSLAFAPYLAESATQFLQEGAFNSRVVRQGGTGLIVRSDGDVVLRHQNHHATLSREEAVHYLATVRFRSEVYDVLRMQDEVVLATVGHELFLSHPQSELWLGSDAIAALVDGFHSESRSNAEDNRASLPEWLSVSTGGGRLLLSDQRTARWVLLGDDHVHELERRLEALRVPMARGPRREPPTISLKGLIVHLQSAFKLLTTLENFADSGNVAPFEEIAPDFSLTAARSTEGIELKDSNNRVALTSREARKWAGIIRAELGRLHASQVERGAIRTVFADNEDGRWILQWGDEVFVSSRKLSLSDSSSTSSTGGGIGSPVVKHAGEFALLLSRDIGACVALTGEEARYLEGS